MDSRVFLPLPVLCLIVRICFDSELYHVGFVAQQIAVPFVLDNHPLPFVPDPSIGVPTFLPFPSIHIPSLSPFYLMDE
jgi:hypothetical protein